MKTINVWVGSVPCTSPNPETSAVEILSREEVELLGLEGTFYIISSLNPVYGQFFMIPVTEIKVRREFFLIWALQISGNSRMVDIRILLRVRQSWPLGVFYGGKGITVNGG